MSINDNETMNDILDEEITQEDNLEVKENLSQANLPKKEEIAFQFVEGLIERMNLDIEVDLIELEGSPAINLSGNDNGIAIGHRGDALDAIQYLTILASNKNSDDYKKIVVDAENYRGKRKATLQNLAERLADKALMTGRVLEVEPMNPYERKIVHSALSEYGNIKTESEGVEPNRYIVITPLNPSNERSNDFSRNGLGKVRSFGNKKRRF